MASKWKYASIDADRRLELLKKGNKELFDEEVARTREITKARRELGLDTKEQEDWMDTVGYSYSTSLAEDGQKVSEKGYAKLYLDDKGDDGGISPVKAYKTQSGIGTAYISGAKSKITKAEKLAKKALENEYAALKEEIRSTLYGKYPYLEEKVFNEGASLEGGKMKRLYDGLEKELSEIYAELEKEYGDKLSDISERYEGYRDEISEYRKNGTAKESLGVIADVLIKNAAKKDGFDYSVISGLSGKNKGYEDDAAVAVKKPSVPYVDTVKAEAGDGTELTETASDAEAVKMYGGNIGEALKKVFRNSDIGKIGEKLSKGKISSEEAMRLMLGILTLASGGNEDPDEA